MKLIAMIDEKGGMAFNKRRLTRDIVQRKYLNSILKGQTLWMNPYSEKLFLSDLPDVLVKTDPDFLSLAGEEEYVLLELDPVPENITNITEVILFHWNRSYPGDLYFTLPERMELSDTQEFRGSSHDLITVEVYKRI